MPPGGRPRRAAHRPACGRARAARRRGPRRATRTGAARRPSRSRPCNARVPRNVRPGSTDPMIVVGTSSWADPGFVEEWYPEDLPARERLAWYAERFDAVEVNSTFYAVPSPRTVERWADETPDGFTFDVKLHRLLSRHSADLKS